MLQRDMVIRHNDIISYLAAFIMALFTTASVLISTYNYGIESERRIQIFSVFILLYWGVQFLFFALSNPQKTHKKWEFLLFIVAFCLISAYFLNTVWNSGYLTNDPIYAIAATENGIHSDSMHHAAIAQSLLNYKIPSLLVNSLSFYNYHFGSHILMALLSWIVNIPAYYAYCFLYPVVFFPLYIYLILSVSSKLKMYLVGSNKIEVFDLFFVVWFVIPELPLDILNKCAIWKMSWIVSESYFVSLIFALLYLNCILYVNEKRWFENPVKKKFIQIFVSPIFILMTALSKISVGVFLCMGIIYYIFRMHTKELYYWVLNFYYGFLFLCLYFGPTVFDSSFRSANYLTYYELFSFYRRYVQSFWYILPHLIILYFFAGVVFVWCVRKKNVLGRIREKKCIPEEILIIICLTGAVPGMLFDIIGGSAVYFSYVQQLAAVLLIISYDIPKRIFNFLRNGKLSMKRVILLTMLLSIFTCLILNGITISRGVKSLLVKSLNNRSESSIEFTGNTNWLSQSKYIDSTYMTIITEINQLTNGKKGDFYLYIDESAEIWNRFSNQNAALYFYPSMTGIVEIGALYCEDGVAFCNNDKEYAGLLYVPNSADEKMSLDDALRKCYDDEKVALIYIYEDTMHVIQVKN